MADDARVRLFVAVEIPDGVRDGLEAAAEPLRRRLPGARWVASNVYHVTLAFVGWADDSVARAVEESCAAAASAVGPFTLSLSGGAGTFGGGVLWAGLADSEPLRQLAAALRERLIEQGLPVDQRPFHAHVTLARAGRDARIAPGLAGAYVGPRSTWPVKRLVMMRSRLRRPGAQYSVEGAWLLGRGSRPVTD